MLRTWRAAIELLPAPPFRLDQVFELASEDDRAVGEVAKRRCAVATVLQPEIASAADARCLPHLTLRHAPAESHASKSRAWFRLLKTARGDISSYSCPM